MKLIGSALVLAFVLMSLRSGVLGVTGDGATYERPGQTNDKIALSRRRVKLP
jgi:hypothetical protein